MVMQKFMRSYEIDSHGFSDAVNFGSLVHFACSSTSLCAILFNCSYFPYFNFKS